MSFKRARQIGARLLGGGPPVVAVVKLSGTIAPSARASNSLSLESLSGALEKAFTGKWIKAVALQINSPGGTAAQSMLIHARIRALAEQKKLPVFAFAEDVAASGGYMLACAADEIYASESSILGSIGVISAGFGFEKLIEKAGVERRVYTAGLRKSLLDPFLPAEPQEIERLRNVQLDIHDSFKALVRKRRGSRLKAPEEELFSGEFWTGTRAVTLGLADGIADLRGEMRRRYGEEVAFRVIAPERRRFRLWPGGGTTAPASSGLLTAAFAEDMLARIEARAIWARFGL